MADLSIQDQLFATALAKLQEHERSNVFNPEFPELGPTAQQLEILKDTRYRVKHVLGGNRCLAKGTLVLTSTGPKPIEEIQVGDIVFNEFGKEIKVLNTFKNGSKPVVTLCHRSWDLVDCTLEHQWLTTSNAEKNNEKLLSVNAFEHDTCVKRVLITPDTPHTHNTDYINIKVVNSNKVVETYDIHVDSPTNLYVLANGLVCHNSGKSQIGSRIVTWWFNGTHPYEQRPAAWGSRPLTIIVLGRVGEQLETELYRNKIKPYLTPGTYTERRIGGVLARIEHNINKNVMLFFSHHNISEAREKVQAFTTDVIWLDEMADSASFLAELMTRILTTDGKMICTFTPLVRSDEVRKMVDGATHPAKKYTLSMLDNPLFKLFPERKEAMLSLFKDLSESERNTRINGDWYLGSNAVYVFNAEKHVKSVNDYSQHWRHIVSVDPAASGKSGLTVWAEDPGDGIWYCVMAEYINGPMTAPDLISTVENKVKYLNVIKRVADPHETNYFLEAAKRSLHYVGVYKKNERKKELIDQLNTALGQGSIKIAPHCIKLIDELNSCQFKENTLINQIVNASSYHILDSAQYFLDNKPKFVKMPMTATLESFDQQLRLANKEKKIKEAAKERKKMKIRKGRAIWRA